MILKYVKLSILLKTKPPFFIGSQIRGGLGYALKNVVCINPTYKCQDCFASKSCIYFEYYEKKSIFHKYRLDFNLGSEVYDFSYYLFDDSIKNLPYIVSAFYKLFTQIGLSKRKIIYKEFDMFVNDELITKNSNIELPKDYSKTLSIDLNTTSSDKIKIEFITPLRIKKQNRLITVNNLEIEDLLNSINKRYLQLQNRPLEKFGFKSSAKIVKKDLKFLDLKRYSNRQKTGMNLGGLVGTIEINDIDELSYKLFRLAELIGVGKQTTFGLGKIKVSVQS